MTDLLNEKLAPDDFAATSPDRLADALRDRQDAATPGRFAWLGDLARKPGLLLAIAWLALLLVAAFVPQVLAPGDPLTGVPADKLQAPSAAHWFGTDQLGRDLYTRVVHGTHLTVEAAHAGGSRWWSVLFRHVLPNAAGPVVVLAALQLGAAILAVSALSFLGYGAPPPAPEWGALVSGGRDYLRTSWWLTTLPGLTIALTVLAAGRISRAVDHPDGGAA